MADYLGPFNVLTAGCLCFGLIEFSFLALSSPASFIIFCILYGFFNGTYVAAFPACVASLTPDMSELGAKMGMYLGIGGFAAISGTPINGACE